MENQRAWFAPSQYFTKRWLKLHQPSSHLMTTDSYSPGDHRYIKNNRKFSATGLSQTSSFTKYHIQELCLDNNKLLIIDSERQLNGLARTSKNTQSFKGFRKSGNQEYFPSFGNKTAKSQLITAKENLRRKSNNQKENKPSDAKLACNLSTLVTSNGVNNGRNIMKKLAFNNKKKINQNQLTFEVQQTQYQSPIKVTINVEKVKSPSKSKRSQKQSHSPQKSKRSIKLSNSATSKRSKKGQKLMNSPTKSLRAPTSRQKSQKSQKSLQQLRSQRSIRTTNKSPKKVLRTIDIVQEKEFESKVNSILPELSQQVSEQLQINRDHVMAQLLDPIELVNFVQPMYRLMTDPYQDFPQWGAYPLQSPPILVEPQLVHHQSPSTYIQQLQQDPHGQTTQTNVLQRKLTLPVEQIEETNRLITVQSKEKLVDRSMPALIQENADDGSKRCSSLLASVDHELLIDLEKKERCLTTKATDKPLDSPTNQERLLPIFQTKVKSSSQRNIEIVPIKQVKNIFDNDFNLKQHFCPQEKITLIDIKPTNHTAYFPSSLKNPIYILPNPSNSSNYKNMAMIDLINLFLKVKPSILKEIFYKIDGPFYKCCLYQNGQRKVISVDGLFPYDENYYPLFGSVEQYIWFGVLLKAIAKLRGSYKQLSALDFKQLFSTLTNNKLHELSSYLQSSRNPSKDIVTLQREAQKAELFILITENDKFYKLDKISYLKSISQQQEEIQQQLMIKNTKLRGSSKKESNMSSLNNFIKKEKKQLTMQRIYQNTKVRLIGVQSKKNIALAELLSSKYDIWMPCNYRLQTQGQLLDKTNYRQ